LVPDPDFQARAASAAEVSLARSVTTIRTAASAAPVAAGLLVAAGAAWAVVAVQAGGMESAPGTMGLSAGAFLGLWAVMMAAMMLPGLAPVGALYAGEGVGRAARAAGLVTGYLVAWAAFGLLALLASVAAGRLADRSDSAATWLGAILLVGTGAYQLSPLKDRCLAICRSPLHLLMRAGAYRGRIRHVRAGLYHGAYCVGCCWSLMLALLVLGVMDLRWMAAFAVGIVLEKVWRFGRHVALAMGVALVILGLLAPSHPGIVPGLHRAPMPMEPM
jgi:predicted metal-binding membrane protein